MKLTSQQELILKYDGSCVVIASPGSGKTYVISEKIKQNLRLLKEYHGVIAISYTNKASNELKSRSLSKGENPLSSFFGTIDKFFLSEIIIPFARQIWGISDNEIKVVKIGSLDIEERDSLNWFTEEVLSSNVKDEHISVLRRYFKEGLIFIETIGLLGNHIYHISLACRKYIKSRYKFLYIDEYQDSGYEQHQLFLNINELGVKSIAVGDLNQSIYAFSGKDSKYLESLIILDSFKYFALNKNHRCHPSIINYSNYLLNPKTELIECENSLIYFFRIIGAEDAISAWIDKYVDDLLKSFSLEHKNQIAILTRSNRTASLIKGSLKTSCKLFITNQLDLNLNVWSGVFSNLLLYLLDSKHKFMEIVEEFTLYEKLTKKQKQKLLNLKGKLDKTSKYEELDIDDLSNVFIQIAEILAPNSMNIESILLLNSILRNEAQFYSYKPASKDEINIMTLHKSKGLEFDIVIHLDMYEWVFPNKRPGPNNDFNNPIFGDWKQDLNLHYVGVTRAKKSCILISSSKRTKSNEQIGTGKKSEFLDIQGIEKLRVKID